MEIHRSSGLMWDYTNAQRSAPSCLSQSWRCLLKEQESVFPGSLCAKYVDDAALMALSEEELQRRVLEWQEQLQKGGLKMNAEK